MFADAQVGLVPAALPVVDSAMMTASTRGLTAASTAATVLNAGGTGGEVTGRSVEARTVGRVHE